MFNKLYNGIKNYKLALFINLSVEVRYKSVYLVPTDMFRGIVILLATLLLGALLTLRALGLFVIRLLAIFQMKNKLFIII